MYKEIVFAVLLNFCILNAIVAQDEEKTIGPIDYCLTTDPTIKIRPPVCPLNEVFSCCGPCVEKICKTMFIEPKCLLPCTKGCFCRPGYIRRTPGGRCIPTSMCFIKF
uniref:TIL domain-containing protein n=1 Tax=Anopheles albimanus TaxID=7167 RepID=A0A182F8Y0_ANOAL